MEEHEITIKVTISYEELVKLLEEKGMKHRVDFNVTDQYMIAEEFNDLEKYDEKRLINMSVRIRKFEYSTSQEDKNRREIVKKNKNFDDNDDIINEEKVVCTIKDEKEAMKLLKSLGYVELFTIEQKLTDYIKDNIIFTISQIDDEVYLELESHDMQGNKIFLSVDDMIEEIDKYNIPHENGKYFQQKAINKLKKLRAKKK